MNFYIKENGGYISKRRLTRKLPHNAVGALNLNPPFGRWASRLRRLSSAVRSGFIFGGKPHGSSPRLRPDMLRIYKQSLLSSVVKYYTPRRTPQETTFRFLHP